MRARDIVVDDKLNDILRELRQQGEDAIEVEDLVDRLEDCQTMTDIRELLVGLADSYSVLTDAAVRVAEASEVDVQDETVESVLEDVNLKVQAMHLAHSYPGDHPDRLGYAKEIHGWFTEGVAIARPLQPRKARKTAGR